MRTIQSGGRVSMKHLLSVLAAAVFVVGFAATGDLASAAEPGLSLEKIMADPDWIGPAVRDAYWSADGRTVYYSLKRSGSPIIDLHRIDPVSSKDKVVDAAAMADADGPAIYAPAPPPPPFLPHQTLFLRHFNPD